MGQVMVFQPTGACAAVITPNLVCGLTLEQIGAKATPAGLKFWIVDSSTIPTDKTFRDAWELDEAALGEPSGYGEE